MRRGYRNDRGKERRGQTLYNKPIKGNPEESERHYYSELPIKKSSLLIPSHRIHLSHSLVRVSSINTLAHR